MTAASRGWPALMLAGIALTCQHRPLTAQPGWQFTSVAAQSGVALTIVAGTPKKGFLVETMTGGVCVLDYDRDGWPDIFFVNGTTRPAWNRGTGPSDRLYRNQGDGTFSDVTRRAGLAESGWGMGCAAADFDNDGDPDLGVANFGPNYLFRNNGNGTFTDIAGSAGVAHPGWSTGLAWGDYDRDGDLDLYLANYVDFNFDKPQGDPRFCSYRGVTVACGPKGLPGARDVLFRNNGDGTFTDVSAQTGIAAAEKQYGFQPLFTDIDLDGDLDIFVANDSTPNFLWINDGSGRFSDEALMQGAAYNQEGREQANMGVAVADLDRDGQFDLYSTNFSDDYNVLYRNSGQGYYTDATFSAGIAQVTFQYLGFGTLFADLDNDGLLDIFVANGHIYPEVDTYNLGSRYRQKNQVFHNRGEAGLVSIEGSLGPGLAIVKTTRGAAAADWDRDGDLDLVLSNLDDPVDLLRNDLPGGSHFLQVHFRGRASNRDGIGTRVVLSAGGVRQMQELHSGSSFLSSSELMLHFGLGPHRVVDRLEIFWPRGTRQTLENVPGDRSILVDENGRHRLDYR